MTHLNFKQIRTNLLVAEAKRWLQIIERGNNKGQIIEMFQNEVDGKAQGEPWCMAFVQYCLNKVDTTVDAILQCTLSENFRQQVYPSEHCLTTWDKSPDKCILPGPKMGSIVIWQKDDTRAGHTGIVVAVARKQGYMWTIEGNTGPQKGVDREGDGVYMKKRNILRNGSMIVRGYLNPWPQEFSVDLH